MKTLNPLKNYDMPFSLQSRKEHFHSMVCYVQIHLVFLHLSYMVTISVIFSMAYCPSLNRKDTMYQESNASIGVSDFNKLWVSFFN